MPETKIRTPKGIRFDCSGCGNCCLQWPVPLTAQDREHIRNLDLETSGLKLNSDKLFQKLNPFAGRPQGFTHTLEKEADGKCGFLTEDNRCYLHLHFGAESKPSMCRLFPHFFTITPQAVLGSVSFASSAVLFNTGKLLSEQSDMLQTKLNEFQKLFPNDPSGWHKLQVIDGFALSWEDFSGLDDNWESVIHNEEENTDKSEETFPRNLPDKLFKLSALAADLLDSPQSTESGPNLECNPKIVDQLILKYLDKLYFPENVFEERNFDFATAELLTEIVSKPDAVHLDYLPSPSRFSDLIDYKLGQLPPEMEALIDRFLYCRFFSKLFFGPGFHYLSLLAGTHHLLILNILIRLKLKYLVLSRQVDAIGIMDLAEIIRTMERRLTQLALSRESKAALEVLLMSRERINRLLYLCD